MNTQEICQELISLADREIEEVERFIPDDPIQSFLLFTEVTRVCDYLIMSHDSSKNLELSVQKLDIIKNGWNLAASYFFKSLDVKGFPIRQSTDTTRNQAASLLYKLGCVTLLKRVADMVKSGVLSAEKKENTYTFRKTDISDSQFLDTLEFYYLNKLEDNINSSTEGYYAEWNLVNSENLADIYYKPGNFLSINKTDFSSYLISDIDSAMLPLVRPWDSGHGIMMAYDTTPEIDNHFLAKATELVIAWRDDAGLHPDTCIEGMRASDLSAVVIFIVSFHLKHVHYASLAVEKYPEISIPQSLTIWAPLDNLIQDIADFSKMDISLISRIFNLIMLKASDSTLLKTHTSKFMPLIIDIGNGFVLRPISSLIQNPFFSIFAVLEHRNPKIRHDLSVHREKWLRSFINALFAGSRYQNITSGIKLREGNAITTDIDAAIYDNLTGELALFQIKWQDFFYNDVKKLRSKASNLTKELDEWSERVTHWLKQNGANKLIRTLGIKLNMPMNESSIFLFGISRNVARVHGYGYKIKSENLSIGNWPQFARNRFEIGPAERVIKKLFETLKSQQTNKVSSKPLPAVITISNRVFYFKDLWSSIED